VIGIAGTRNAVPAAVRALILVLAACAGPVRPGLMPKLSELPAEPDKRDAVLDASMKEPTPEQKKPLPKKWQTVETVAATAAAVVGLIFSKTKTVTLGGKVGFDETMSKPIKHEQRDEAKKPDEPVQAEPPTDLVPWVRLDGRPQP
jgi:hypothetical protein